MDETWKCNYHWVLRYRYLNFLTLTILLEDFIKLMDGFKKHVNPSRVILYLEVRESHSLYSHIYIFCEVLKIFLYGFNYSYLILIIILQVIISI